MAARSQADDFYVLQPLPPVAVVDSPHANPDLEDTTNIPVYQNVRYEDQTSLEANNVIPSRRLRDSLGQRIPFPRYRPRRSPENVHWSRKHIVRALDAEMRGHRNLATFIDSDQSFMIYRRFGYLQARCLLEKQDELRELEEKLDNLDDSNCHDLRYTTSRTGSDVRHALLKEIQSAFVEYSEMLAAAHRMLSFSKPAESEYESVLNYLTNFQPIALEETAYIHSLEDLVTIRAQKEQPWLDRNIEQLILRLRSVFPVLAHLFGDPKRADKTQSAMIFYSGKRVKNLSAFITTCTVLAAILALLIVPIYLLYRQVSGKDGDLTGHILATCLGILVTFTVGFSGFMLLFTDAKRHETLAAAAAYCAVLVVFLGNVN